MNLEEAIKELKLNNEEGFNYIYNNTKSIVFGVIKSVLFDISLSEDAMQDTYIKVINNIDKYNENKNFITWILKIAKNTAIDYYRKYKREINIDVSQNEYLFKNEKVEQEGSFLSNYLLSKLNLKERQIVVLYALEDYSHKEVAEITNLPIGTVTSIYSNAMKKLKKVLESEGK